MPSRRHSPAAQPAAAAGPREHAGGVPGGAGPQPGGSEAPGESSDGDWYTWGGQYDQTSYHGTSTFISNRDI